MFEEIQAAVLHVSGSEDRLIPTMTAERLSQRTCGEFVRLAGIGNDIHLESPERRVREIERFLEATTARKATNAL